MGKRDFFLPYIFLENNQSQEKCVSDSVIHSLSRQSLCKEIQRKWQIEIWEANSLEFQKNNSLCMKCPS